MVLRKEGGGGARDEGVAVFVVCLDELLDLFFGGVVSVDIVHEGGEARCASTYFI